MKSLSSDNRHITIMRNPMLHLLAEFGFEDELLSGKIEVGLNSIDSAGVELNSIVGSNTEGRGGSRQSPQTHGRRSTIQSLIFLSLLADIYGVPSPKENSSINIKKPFLNFFVQP